MKFFIFIIGSVFSLNLCRNCKHFIKPTGKKVGTCSLFPLLDKQYLDCIRARKIYYMCGDKGRYYEDVLVLDQVNHINHVDHVDHVDHVNHVDHVDIDYDHF